MPPLPPPGWQGTETLDKQWNERDIKHGKHNKDLYHGCGVAQSPQHPVHPVDEKMKHQRGHHNRQIRQRHVPDFHRRLHQFNQFMTKDQGNNGNQQAEQN